jgi:hypothetical protein
MGLYADEKAALHQPLPHIEDAARRIEKWNDSPDPVGFGLCPRSSGLRARAAMEIEGTTLKKVTSRLFNAAFPQLVAPEVRPGDRVVLEGVAHEGPVAFVIPEAHLAVHVEVGEKKVTRAPTIEEVGIDLPKRQVFLGYRYPFKYTLAAFETRRCTLVTSHPSAVASPLASGSQGPLPPRGAP